MHIVTPVSEGLRYLNWPTGKKNIIIPAKTSLHSLRWVREKAEEILSKKTGVGGVNDRTQKDVSLKIIKVGWLNNEVRQFFQYLAKSEKPSIYDNELIKTLLDQQDYTQKIMLVTILPYIVYLLSLFLYFHTYLARDVEDDQDFWDSDLLATCLRSLIYILSGYLMVLEYYQMKLQKVRYWLQWWNYMQLSMFILNIALVLAHTWNLTQISRMHMDNIFLLVAPVPHLRFLRQLGGGNDHRPHSIPLLLHHDHHWLRDHHDDYQLKYSKRKAWRQGGRYLHQVPNGQ
jgi:hypothetical protein